MRDMGDLRTGVTLPANALVVLGLLELTEALDPPLWFRGSEEQTMGTELTPTSLSPKMSI